MLPENAPATDSERIVSLDILRGFALLGILIVNMQSFAMVMAAYGNPSVFGDLTGTNYLTWLITFVFFDSKMMTIFSLLFGVGIVLMYERSQKQSGRTGWLHYRRMFWLVLFGLAHAHLLWYGDILYAYGLCGMLIYWAKRWRPSRLIAVGLFLIAVPSGLFLLLQASLPYMDEAALAELSAVWTPSPEAIDTEISIYRGTWIEQMAERSEMAFVAETFIFAIFFFWRAGGLMLVGMGLFKLRLFDASHSTQFYATVAIGSLVAGLTLVLLGVRHNFAVDWELESAMFGGAQFNYWGSLLVSLGYICIIMLVCKHKWLPWLRQSFQAIGQMALTNYLLQTLICTTIFYGHGLALFGSVSRTGQLGIVIAIWISQMIASPLWLKKFRFGPFEWLWRSLAYWRLQPMMRSTEEH